MPTGETGGNGGSEPMPSFFRQDLIFFCDPKTPEEVFRHIGGILCGKGLVKPGFVRSLIQREADYPTGLDLSPVAGDLPNVAIPHTEAEYCADQAIAVVKLNHEISFRNMMAPEKEIKVRYLFFIVNHEKEQQSRMLSYLMEIFTDEKRMRRLDQLEDPAEIYRFFTSHESGRSVSDD
jgi:galactose PTS system EIIA component